jgi:branched-subunit amino acid aminotransferase/4-amino-4-deoxychorismate lyase
MELDGRAVDADTLATLALYNYGHFTSMLVDGGRVRGLRLHLDRLRRDCRLLFDADLDVDHVRELVRRACGLRASVARVTVFAPDLDLGRPGQSLHPQVLVTTRAATDPPPPVRLRLTPYERELPTLKHAGLFGTVWHRRQAQLAGFDDVAFVDDAGRICEGATWNIGFVQDDQVIWPAGESLQGVTMDLLKGIPGVRWRQQEVDAAGVAGMQAAFITNAAVGVRAVTAIDSRQYPVGVELIETLRGAYLALPGEPL